MKGKLRQISWTPGFNPFEARGRSARGNQTTFGDLFARYHERYAKPRLKRWIDLEDNYRRYFQRWTNRRIASITRAAVQRWVDDLARSHGKYCANRCHDTMRAVFNWAIRKDYFTGRNPCYGVDRYKMKSRSRFVQPGDEFMRLAEAIDEEPNHTLRDFFWICIFTGERKSNVLAMRWDEIDFALKTWRIPDTKNGDSQIVSLTTYAQSLLQKRRQKVTNQWVFPSDRAPGKHMSCPKFAWKRILDRACIQDLRIHDLRRYPRIIAIMPRSRFRSL